MIQTDASGDRPAAFGSLKSLRILGGVDPPLCNFMTNSGSAGPPGQQAAISSCSLTVASFVSSTPYSHRQHQQKM